MTRKKLFVLTAPLACALACGSDDQSGNETQAGSSESSSSGTTEAPASGTTADIEASTEASESGPPEPSTDPPTPVATIAELFVPYDVNEHDLVGPSSWATNYGKSPEIAVISEGNALIVLAHDYAQAEAPTGPWAPDPEPDGAVVLKLEPIDGVDYVITQAVADPPFIDRILGVASDGHGSVFVATAISEDADLTPEYPGPDEYREGIVHVAKLDWDGNVAFETDLDIARKAVDERAEKVINPMVAATARLAYGAGTVALVHGINTDPDPSIDYRRHQKALTTHLDAATGDVTRTSTIWVSHSFDQRLFHDGNGFVEMHLGDAYPRHVAFARIGAQGGREYPLLYVKGEHGDNNTFTRLGDVVPLPSTADNAFMAVFATERTTSAAPTDGQIAGSRELALVLVRRDFEQLEEGRFPGAADLPDTFEVQSDGGPATNRLRWLTDFEGTSGGTTHAERPKLVSLGDRFVVLWEQWTMSGGETFEGTYAMVVDETGKPVVEPTLVTDTHLPRGDDAVAVEIGHTPKATWVTGNRVRRELHVHQLDAELTYTRIVIE